MLNVGADHPHDAFAANDLAVFTNSADAAANFHDNLPYRFLPPQKGRTEHYMFPYGFFNPLRGLEKSKNLNATNSRQTPKCQSIAKAARQSLRGFARQVA
jgi:hypothetical protein